MGGPSPHSQLWRWDVQRLLDNQSNASGDPPPNPLPGTFWWENDTGKLYVWYQDADSAAWVEVLAGSGAQGPKGDTGPAADWSTITGKPATFPPTVPIGWADISGKPTKYPDADLLDGQEGTHYLARANHTGQQAIATVTNLTAQLAAKEPSLPAGGTTATFLRGDKTWVTPPASIDIGDTPPVSPVDKQFYWESDTGILWLRYNDGSSVQWVQVNSGGGGLGLVDVGDTAPVAPFDRQLYWESDTGILWLRYNDGSSSQWIQINGMSGSVAAAYEARIAGLEARIAALEGG